MDERAYDVVVVGAGPTGENVADRVKRGGLSVAVVEKELVGGECSYWACIPSKALLRPAAALDAARGVAGARQAVTGVLDAGEVLRRRDGFVSGRVDTGQVDWLRGAGIDLVRGRGRLTGPRRVEVEDPTGARTVLTARHAVALCTGSVPVLPDIAGLAETRPWTSREATEAEKVPESLVVIGGGVVACELAWAWRSLGARVRLLVRGERLLARNEPFAGEHVRRAMEEAGLDVVTRAEVREAVRDDAGQVTVGYTTPEGEASVTAAQLLVATGRRPATGGVGLETVGLDPSAPIEVGDDCRVDGVEGGWLYAVGDVNGRALLTHMGKYQARACGDAIAARARGEAADPAPWSRWSATADHRAVPQVVFTEPEVAAVGLTEEAARAAGMDVRAVDYDLGSVAGATLYADGYRGHARMVVDERRRVVVGCTLVGPGVGELIHAATVAVVGEVPLERLWHAVPSFPTVSEVWLRLLETYGL
ncbi:dihydrolipoyl dehydrogenase family protein [Marinactinospora thermotolerans]|uniref:Dihydrolipoamide dehydrogenase n=1 Tax=Marinactinospora thermotolerans DSM 45154 TaxID=1122192 RepID=A0A1T4K1K2_9ACTN|nr:NAD(P)/FAD-dependent oxidoreductase [Marinactinospora thermotolerans]SJZ36340.1 dihydrolipoamide dehydrogenase [Marinactinospora thermotolerans DSM 45154]